MEVKANPHGDYTTMMLKGRLDLTSSTQLKEQIKGLLGEGKRHIVIDMGEVDFINSSGLGTLVSILKDVRMVRGRMVLCSLAKYVEEIFEITQLSHIFDIYLTEDEAVASFSASTVNAN